MRNILWACLLLSGHVLWAQDNYIDLVWSDEFHTAGAPDASNWGYDIGHGANGWGNREMQSYTNNSQNVRVEGGMLVIHAIKDSNGEWTSARVKSQGKRSFTYGRIVWRARLPEGSGTWPALWMLAENVTTLGWPAGGEIDVMEHVGKWPGTVLSAIHTSSSFGDTQNKATTQVSTFQTEFHEYELLWTPEKLAFSVDGQNHYTYSPATKNQDTWPFNAPFFLIMNIAMGGGLGSDPQYETGGLRNGIDPAITQAKMEVDYVRVYQAFNELALEGPAIVARDQEGLRYGTNKLTGATYEWVVPSDAVITSGQGTSEIIVDWGRTEGSVKVTVTVGGETFEKEIPVTHLVKPQGALFPLMSPEFDIQWADADPVNEYSVSHDAGATRVDYNVTTPSSAVSLTGTLLRALDLSNHPVLHVRAKTLNRSRTVRMRLDLVDDRGMATNKSPVFNLLPLIDDGAYYDYRFDFSTANRWQGETGAVDASRIAKINVYVDFGVFGSAGADSLWIESISVATHEYNAPVNRPSHLTGAREGGSILLSWRDNADDETGFTVHLATSENGVYSASVNTDANIQSVAIPVTDPDVIDYYFKVSGSDGAGVSEFSNVFHVEETITSVGEEHAPSASVYPNPAASRLVYVWLPVGPVSTLRVFDASGVEMLTVSPESNPVLLDLRPFPAGFYLISISGERQIARRKLLLL